MNPIPITIFTGFLGAGKTTFINKIVNSNPNIKFGFIINEFGEVGIDGQLIENLDTGGEIVELSNGCICCVVRDDLVGAAEKVIDSGKVEYLIIEASGLADPLPVAETFSYENLEGKIKLDSVICLVDMVNFKLTDENYRIAAEQIKFADFLILNKIEQQKKEVIAVIKDYIRELNPLAPTIENFTNQKIDSELIIDTGRWKKENLINNSDNHVEEHHHEHDNVDEIVFTTTKLIDPAKMDDWMNNRFPKNIIRAKGFLRFDANTLGHKSEVRMFLFQLAGLRRSIEPFETNRKDFDHNTSRLVFIGKDLNRDEILNELEATTIN